VRIGRQVEPSRPPLDRHQRDLLDRVEADGAEPDRLGDSGRHDRHREGFRQPQY
jgi:hypothetical protein